MKNVPEVKMGSNKKKRDNSRKVLHSLDKVINTPTASRNLLDESLDASFDLRQPDSNKNKEKVKENGHKASFKKLKKSLSDTVLKKFETNKSGNSDQPDQNAKTKSGNSGADKLDNAKTKCDNTGEQSNNAKSRPGDILRQGIKFTSQNSFMRYINMPSKGSRSKKRKLEEIVSPPPFTGAENQAFTSFSKEEVEEEETEERSPIRKRKKLFSNKSYESLEDSDLSLQETTDSVHHRLNKSRIREILSLTKSESGKKTEIDSATDTTSPKKKSFVDKAKDRLASSRFRYINEILYTQTSAQSAKMFKEDTSMFQAYHEGFQKQAGSWPVDPLDTIISACLHLPDEAVIADMGCGEARLARSLRNTVHSFDLVASAPGVIECDMSKVPLPDQSIDVVVFCLSLMGTNIKDFLLEASRILKTDGILKIAELESRFQGQENDFIKDVEKFGFHMNWKNLKNQYFVFFDFKKVKEAKARKKLPNLSLKPCLYKKR